VEHRDGTIGVDGNVCVLMHQQVVAWTLADNPKVVDERLVSLPILERSLEALLRNASRLIFITGGFADPANTLRLKMGFSTNVVAVDGKGDQRVQGAT